MGNSVGKGRLRPACETIGGYLREKMEQSNGEVTIKTLVKAVKPENSNVDPQRTIINLLENNRLPTYYSYFIRICDALGVEKKKLKEWEKTEPAYLFGYFNKLRPDAPDLKYIAVLIRERNKKYSIYELAEKTGLQMPTISRTELMNSTILFETFERFCNAYEEKPIDLLNELAAYPDSVKATENITQYIYNGMEISKVSLQDAPEELGYTKEKFEKLFYARTKFYIDDIRRLSVRFALSAESLYRMVYRAGLNGPDEEFNEATTTGVLPKGERRVSDLTNIVMKYKKITDNNFSVETHTLLTLLYLILYAKDTEKYRMEIMYYLEHLNDSGNLFYEFVKMKLEWNDYDGIKLFNAIREERDLSFSQIGRMVGASTTHTINVCQKHKRIIPDMIEKVSEAIQISPAVLLEGYFDSESAAREEASVWAVVSTIQATILWNMEGQTVRTNTLSEIVRIIYNKQLSPKQKYNEIKKLKFN